MTNTIITSFTQYSNSELITQLASYLKQFYFEGCPLHVAVLNSVSTIEELLVERGVTSWAAIEDFENSLIAA